MAQSERGNHRIAVRQWVTKRLPQEAGSWRVGGKPFPSLIEHFRIHVDQRDLAAAPALFQHGRRQRACAGAEIKNVVGFRLGNSTRGQRQHLVVFEEKRADGEARTRPNLKRIGQTGTDAWSSASGLRKPTSIFTPLWQIAQTP